MYISWIPLMGGLFFGLIPPRLLIASKCKYFECQGLKKCLLASGDAERKERRWWKLPLVWIDPVRGYVTASLLSDALHVAPHAAGFDRLMVMLITAVLLLTVLWVQTECRLRLNGPRQTVSPTAFLAGMIVGLLHPMVAIAALVLGLAAAMALTNFTAGYGAASLATLTIGLVFSRNFPQVGLNGFLVAFPMLVSWVRRTPLVMPVRN